MNAQPELPPLDEELMSLHRYFLAANQQRVQFEQMLAEHAEQHGEAPRYGGEGWNESWLAMSYWYAGLYVVIEAWRELGLHDDQRRPASRIAERRIAAAVPQREVSLPTSLLVREAD